MTDSEISSNIIVDLRNSILKNSKQNEEKKFIGYGFN